MASSAPHELSSVYGTLTASGDSSALIAAPGAGYRIVIPYRRLIRGTTTDVTVVFKDGSTAVDSMPLTAEVPAILEALPNDLAFRLSENAALVLNLSTTANVTYRFRYWIETL